MIEDALPRLSAFGAIAEQMRPLDAMTLRASEGVVQSATALAAEMVLETQRIAEAILAASTDEESAELQGRLLDLIVGFVQQLGPRTIAELHEMGLFQWSGWLAGILGLLLAIAALHPDQSPEEKAALAALNQKVEALQQETRRYHEAEARADEAYVADLPRAELSRDATFRREPRREGAVVLKAPDGMVLAIERRQGRWRLVVYRDPLTGQLARAWVHASAVSPLAPPVDADAR
jgi:hypothetical protein